MARPVVQDDAPDRSDLHSSLALLALIVAVALGGLAFAGNWPKVFRVALAATTYTSVLVALTRRTQALGAFVAAGVAAGVVSGLVRTAISPPVVAAGALGAGLLLGPLHWWSLQSWRRHADAGREPGRRT